MGEVSSELASAGPGADAVLPEGSSLPGGILPCADATCAEIVLEDGAGTAAYTWHIASDTCGATAVASGSGTIDLVADLTGYRGRTASESDVFDEVEGNGVRCTGHRHVFDLVAAPA